MAILIGTERFGLKIDIHAAGQCVGHHQRRRCQIVGAHQRIDAAFEVAIATEDGGNGQLPLLHCVRHRFRQGSTVADAGGATIADQIELQFLEIGREAGVV